MLEDRATDGDQNHVMRTTSLAPHDRRGCRSAENPHSNRGVYRSFPDIARLYDRAASHAARELDFGHVVAVLIVIMGLVPFASVGLWQER